MKPGDMDQWDELEEQWQAESARYWRSLISFGIALIGLLVSSFAIGVFFGWLIWGI